MYRIDTSGATEVDTVGVTRLQALATSRGFSHASVAIKLSFGNIFGALRDVTRDKVRL